MEAHGSDHSISPDWRRASSSAGTLRTPRSSIGRLMRPEVLHCSGRIIKYSSGVRSELFLDTPVTTQTSFSADLSWQDAGTRNVFEKVP